MGADLHIAELVDQNVGVYMMVANKGARSGALKPSVWPA